MNYFLHHAVDAIQEDPYYNFGLLLPDLAKHHFASFRNLRYQGDLHSAIVRGCEQHINADKQFHASHFFESKLQKVKHYMSCMPFTNQFNRRWFVAHLLTELMLDRVLSKQRPDLLDSFYHSMSFIVEYDVESFFAYNNAREFVFFWQRFEHFRSVQYIRYYADNNKLIYSLERIMQRVGMPPLSKIDSDLMQNVIEAVEKDYFATQTPLLLQISSIFK